MIPLRTSLRRVFNQEWLGGIYLRARNGSEMERAEDQVRWLLRDRHRLDRVAADDDFEIHTQQEIMAAQQEIGLRLAVGRRRRDIRTQFLTEAVMLGVGGGPASPWGWLPPQPWPSPPTGPSRWSPSRSASPLGSPYWWASSSASTLPTAPLS